jgi:MFS family permease
MTIREEEEQLLRGHRDITSYNAIADSVDESGPDSSLDDQSDSNGRDDTVKEKTNLKVVIPSLWLCAFLAAFDQTVVAAIYPIIGSDFLASNQVSWIATGYLLSNTAFQPLYGRLSDIFGRKRTLILATVIFFFGTLFCATAPGIWWMVAARIIAGLGGGGLNVLGTVIMSDLIPLKKRGTFQGLTNIIYGTGTSLGGPVGGNLY